MEYEKPKLTKHESLTQITFSSHGEDQVNILVGDNAGEGANPGLMNYSTIQKPGPLPTPEI
jgi:hypothetical protein